MRSWSLSNIKLYEQCPFKWKQRYIVKAKEPASVALERGILVHQIAEDYLNGKMDQVPKALIKFKKEFEMLRKNNATAEEEFTLDVNWQTIENGWNHPDVWLRGKIDARVPDVVTVDFKTGRHYPDHEDQARLYSNVVMMQEDVDEIDVEFWYLDNGKVASYSFNRDTLTEDIQAWEKRVKIRDEDTEHLPNRNAYCNYCHFKSKCPEFK